MKQDLKIGQILLGPQDKDCIHVAILPVVAAENITPGSHIGLSNKGEACRGTEWIGVADPFLKTKILTGDTFWMFMYPNTVANMRHSWDHPALVKIKNLQKQHSKSESEEWLKDYAISEVYSSEYHVDREDAYKALLRQVDGGDLTFMGHDCHGLGDVPNSSDLFYHLSVVLDRPINEDSFEYFGCSC